MNIFNVFADGLVQMIQTLDAVLFHAHDSDPYSAPAPILEGAGNLVFNVAAGVFEVGDAMIGAAGGALLALDATHQNLAQIDAATQANLDMLGYTDHAIGGLHDGSLGTMHQVGGGMGSHFDGGSGFGAGGMHGGMF